jgi:hypothetical protein
VGSNQKNNSVCFFVFTDILFVYVRTTHVAMVTFLQKHKILCPKGRLIVGACC